MILLDKIIEGLKEEGDAVSIKIPTYDLRVLKHLIKFYPKIKWNGGHKVIDKMELPMEYLFLRNKGNKRITLTYGDRSKEKVYTNEEVFRVIPKKHRWRKNG